MSKKTPPPVQKDTHIITSDNNKVDKQQHKVAIAPVVVFSKEEEKREQDADAAATQYISSELKKGNKVNESRIRKQALKEKWIPNKDLKKEDILEKFKNGSAYEGINGEYECIKDEIGIGFFPMDFYSPQPYSIQYKSPTFRKDLDETLKKIGLEWVIENENKS